MQTKAFLAATCLLWILGGETSGDTTPKTVFVVPVTGNVDPGMAAFIARGAREASTEADALLVIEMDTFGGRVDAALQIVDTLLNTPVETVAFVKTKAISAGALIALSCRRLVMKHTTTIGDCAPIALSNEGPRMLGEKFQSPLRAKFRTIARRNGYPETLAESMVTADMQVHKV
ncbi:MAG: serine protease, partial [Chitinivibrionales bacterium]|nr:serine protease [Chitinivibrionales bacterium]MBD3397369.1 serine protease [Chitinivibrionales bacterium]